MAHLHLPRDRGALTVHDVLKARPGPERDQAIEDWAASVWVAWSQNREQIKQLLQGLDELPAR